MTISKKYKISAGTTRHETPLTIAWKYTLTRVLNTN